MADKHQHEKHHRSRSLLRLALRQKKFVFAVIIILLLYVISPQISAFSQSLDILSQATLWLVGLAVFLTCMTYVLAGEQYFLLSKHFIPRRRLMLVQAATGLTARLAPIGVGTIGMNIIFLRHQKHTLPEAIAVAATNNGIGVVAHFLLLSLLSGAITLPKNINTHLSEPTVAIILVILAVLVLSLFFFRRLRQRIADATRQTFTNIASYRHKPWTILLALGVAMVISCTYVSVLGASARALGVEIPFSEIFLIFTFSLAAGAATATPGGLVGVEAGLVGGFVAYGIDGSTAIAIALLYRLITYWAPLLPGLIALRTVQHRYL